MTDAKKTLLVCLVMLCIASVPFYAMVSTTLPEQQSSLPMAAQELLTALEPQIVHGETFIAATTEERPWWHKTAIFGILGMLIIATGYSKYKASIGFPRLLR